MSIQPLDLDTAGCILDFSGGEPDLKALGKLQLEGAVALHNMIADPVIGMAYLADEVGMGKTYMALGVVALMRYFNPTLRVLYICPSNNVQEKWYKREYRSFIKHNVKVSQYHIRTTEGESAVPRISCRNIPELLNASSSGYYADFFVGMNAFSLGMSEDPDQLERALVKLEALLPAYKRRGKKNKQSIKEQYARALNYILPTFDLVVIDEAHKFKHGFGSSDRNRVLSGVLGFRDEAGFIPRVKHALLLSATPYDRRLGQLRNQLNMVGKKHLLPDDIEDGDKERTQVHLSGFMVRRLNELHIAGKIFTRNMYRKEWRSGEKAEIVLKSDEQKLVTALVQKKVGEALGSKKGGSSFQTGLLASFESYAESSRSPSVEFDGELLEKIKVDAQDWHAVAEISDTFKKQSLGQSLPHPKMDTVTQQLAKQMFIHGRKQIVFVRRVKSVDEIKNKLDDHYTDHIKSYIRQQLTAYPEALSAMGNVFLAYDQTSFHKENDLSGGEFQAGSIGEADDHQPPKNDNIFTWFFRGELTKEISELLKTDRDQFRTPDIIRKALSARNQIVSTLFEINWARLLCRYHTDDFVALCKNNTSDILQKANRFIVGKQDNDQQDLYLASQLGFISWYRKFKHLPQLDDLLNYLRPSVVQIKKVELKSDKLQDLLLSHSFFDALEAQGLSEHLFPLINDQLKNLLQNASFNTEQMKKLDIHQFLLSQCLRTGHGIIDLYITRLQLGTQNLTPTTRAAWMNNMAKLLCQQSNSEQFSTYQELRNLSENLNLIIKTNLPEAYDKSRAEYRTYFSHMLNPVAPVIGANGATVGSRSAQARKFRMPGYPLALVSTDVFQEGEDLHTFCDSVMHYGLAPSPVGIEQKTGRVDRVGSQTQRRLLQLDEQPTGEELIQVYFPFVRESIEVLQVRQLCHNINDFIRSLHEVNNDVADGNDVVDTDKALKDRSSIPDQINTRLKSPYVPKIIAKSKLHNRRHIVAKRAEHTERTNAHVENLLKTYFGGSVLGRKTVFLPSVNIERKQITVKLNSARASGEILLSASHQAGELSLANMNKNKLNIMMRDMSWNTFHRTCAIETANGTYALYHDAEMLIGDENSTTYSEVAHFFQHFDANYDPKHYEKPLSQQVLQFWKKSTKQGLPQFGPWSISVTSSEQKHCLLLTFMFANSGKQRKHKVKIYESHGRCIFMATASSHEDIVHFSLEQLIKYTWIRNSVTDIVEFMLDDKRNIVGRVVHPIEGMTFEEFFYCASTLATSTDRLEYLIQERDRH